MVTSLLDVLHGRTPPPTTRFLSATGTIGTNDWLSLLEALRKPTGVVLGLRLQGRCCRATRKAAASWQPNLRNPWYLLYGRMWDHGHTRQPACGSLGNAHAGGSGASRFVSCFIFRGRTLGWDGPLWIAAAAEQASLQRSPVRACYQLLGRAVTSCARHGRPG